MQFFMGWLWFFRGARFLFARPKLWVWILIPMLMTLGVFVALALWISQVLNSPVTWLLSYVPFASSFLKPILLSIEITAFASLVYFGFFIVAALIAAPFNEQLSAKVEIALQKKPEPPFSLKRFLGDLLRTITHETRKISSYLFWLFLLWMGSWLIPGLGFLIYVGGAIFLTIRTAAYDGLDYTMSRHALSYQQKRAFLRGRFTLTSGFGSAVCLFLAIPGLNLITMPISAVGGTLLLLAQPGLLLNDQLAPKTTQLRPIK